MPLRVDTLVARPTPIEILVDGETVPAFPGESLAVALYAAGRRRLRASPRMGGPRGMFCLMGACQECVVWVDGRRTVACGERVRAGMDVRTGDGS